MRAPELVARHRRGFKPGWTPILSEADRSVGFDFGVRVMRKGEVLEQADSKETAWLLLQGAALVSFNGRQHAVKRSSLFEEPPTCLHVAGGTQVRIEALGRTEWAAARATNIRRFEPRLFRPWQLSPEYRGKGLVQGAALRNVRLIFDLTNRPKSNLVVGEVVNYPGKWSSYPPHYHPQPEIYHYRFTKPQGYGHGEIGDRVFKVKNNDTLVIRDCHGHAQVSAPGYGMYYIWIVRHLKGRPYRGFKFFPEHRWTLDPKEQGWLPPRS